MLVTLKRFFNVADSPHSSDDEETAMLKSELRRLREEKMGQDNESKKMLLRQVIEQERRAAGVTGPGAAGVTGSSEYIIMNLKCIFLISQCKGKEESNDQDSIQ